MIRRSWAQTASIEETLALWAASLRQIKQRIRPLFKQERVATNAGLFLEVLLGDEQRKTGWMRAEAAGDPGPWRQQAILGRRDWDHLRRRYRDRRSGFLSASGPRGLRQYRGCSSVAAEQKSHKQRNDRHAHSGTGSADRQRTPSAGVEPPPPRLTRGRGDTLNLPHKTDRPQYRRKGRHRLALEAAPGHDRD